VATWTQALFGYGSLIESCMSAEADLKRELRQRLIAARQAIPIQIWQQKSEEICTQIERSTQFQTAQVVLSYLSFRQEVDLTQLYYRHPDKSWGLPRCVGRDLVWHQVDSGQLEQSLSIGKFGILEPLPTLPSIDLETVDLILIPTVACDRQGYRLGYGGGFFDRFLPTQIGYKVGITFNDFYLEHLPVESWDIPMQSIVTESGLAHLYFGKTTSV